MRLRLLHGGTPGSLCALRRRSERRISRSPGIPEGLAESLLPCSGKRRNGNLDYLYTASPELLDLWYRQPVFAGLSPALRENLLRKRRNLQGTTAAAVLRGFSTGLMPCLLPALSAPPVPVLLLSGERDPKYTALFQEIHGPGIARITVPAAGHNIHDELPEKTAALIAGFAAG